MDLILTLLDMALHLDKTLAQVVADYGSLTYILLFAIVFCETGLVITPFLPGDSLLFATGAMAGAGMLDWALLLPMLFVAAVVGDSVNYAIGRRVGPAIFERETRFINKKHLEEAHRFYERHGGKTIVLARFIPIIRTFAPFVAGVATMDYSRFLFYNVTGGFVWVGGLLGAGYLFGNLPVVKDNFSAVIYLIIFLSITPILAEFGKKLLARRR
ncbi:MAG: DedA family protein [Thermodesulfobacteriota bacterium]